MRSLPITATAFISAFLWAIASTSAAPPRAPSVPTGPDRAGIDASNFADEGDAHLELNEFDAAIESYEKGLAKAGLVADLIVRSKAVQLARIDLASAHRMAYDADGRSNHLTEVGRLVKEYRAASTGPSAAVEELEVWLEGRQRASRRVTREPAASLETEPLRSPTKRNHSMVMAGTAIAGVGGGLSVGCLVILGLTLNAQNNYEAADEDIGEKAWRTANENAFKATIATAVLAGASLATGITLILVGKRGRKRDAFAAGGFPLQNGASAAFSGRF